MYVPRQHLTDDDFDFGDTSPTRAAVLAALEEDSACRVPRVTAGLYSLGELAPFARLGHGIPVVRHSNEWRRFRAAQFDRAADDAEFRRRFHRAAPFLADFDLKRHGLCLAGGAASSLLMRSDEDRAGDLSSFHDYDLFLVGHSSDESAKEAIRALQRHLYSQWGGEGRAHAYRTKGCITFHGCDPQFSLIETLSGETPEASDPVEQGHPRRRAAPGEQHLVQVVLRQYSTAAEVIHGFDLGSSAVLWDGEVVRVTALGKLAFERGANVLNLAARRNSYERRLARYFLRGFDLVLPDLNGLEFLKLGGRLPYLFAYGLECRGGCACDLWADNLYATRPEHDSYGRAPGNPQWDAPPEEASDYEAGGITYARGRGLTARNVRALGGEKVWIESLCAHAPLTSDLEIFEIQPALDVADLADLALGAFGENAVRVKSLVTYLGQDGALSLTIEYVASRGDAPNREIALELAAARCSALSEGAVIPFAFMAVDDKTALTGPFPRSLVPTEQWYGPAMNAH